MQGTYVVDQLVRDAAVVLQDVVVLAADGLGDLLGDGQNLGQLVVGDVVQLGAVVFGDDELGKRLVSQCGNVDLWRLRLWSWREIRDGNGCTAGWSSLERMGWMDGLGWCVVVLLAKRLNMVS